MSNLSNMVSDQTREAARELLEQRSQLETWLARLDDQSAEVPAHIAERVRNDYTRRLEDVTARLGDHLDAIRESLAALRAELAAVEDHYRTATDELEEARLRHMLGELNEADWDERRGGLDEAVTAAERHRDTARTEVDGLAALVAEIDAPIPTEPTTPDAEAAAPREIPVADQPVAEPTAAEAPNAEAELWEERLDDDVHEAEEAAEAEQQEDDLPILHREPAPAAVQEADDGDINFDAMFAQWGTETVPQEDTAPAPASSTEAPADEDTAEVDDLAFLRDLGMDAPPPAPKPRPDPPSAGGGEEDFAFLEELDRAIAASGQPSSTKTTGASGGGLPGSMADVDLLCKACGAINDPRAWYCEVCGADLT